MKKALFTFLLFLLSTLFAGTYSSTLSVGSKYNSNIQYLYILQKLSSIKKEKKQGIYLSNGFDFSWTKNADYLLSLQYSLNSDAFPKELNLSEFNQYFSTIFGKNLNDKLTFDTGFQIHQSIENYNSPEFMFFDTLFFGELFYDLSNKFTFFTNFSTSYFHNTSEKIKELRGPAFLTKNSLSFYPSDNETELKVSSGASIYFFRDYSKITCLDCNDFYRIKNKYTKFWISSSVFLDFSTLKLFFSAGFAYFYWLDKDEWQKKKENFIKRRRDNLIFSEISLFLQLSKKIKMEVSYKFNDNISDTGRYELDYTNYSFLQHIFLVNFEWNFEVKK